MEEARALADDLTYMIERGDTIADKLANQIRAGRDALKPDLQPEPKPAAKPQPRPDHIVERIAPVTTAAAQAEAMFRGASVEQARPSTPRPAFVRQEPIRVEPRVAVPAAATAAPAAEPVVERANAPSRAERDLLRALAARRR